MCGNGGVGTSPRSSATQGTNAPGGVQRKPAGKSEEDRGNGSSQNAGREPEMQAAGPLSAGSALQEKRLPVTGRERRQPRAHARPPPPGRTHPNPLPLPTSPAGRLPSSAGPGLQRRPPKRLRPGPERPAVPAPSSAPPTR